MWESEALICKFGVDEAIFNSSFNVIDGVNSLKWLIAQLDEELRAQSSLPITAKDRILDSGP